MVFKSENCDEKEIICTCDCNCGSQIKITKFNTEDTYNLSIGSELFYSEQKGLFNIIKTRIKRAFYDLIGKTYLYTDICLSKQQLHNLVESLKEIQK